MFSLAFCSWSLFSQNLNTVYASVGLRLGYTFHAGLTYSYEINAGLKPSSQSNLIVGLSLVRYWVNVSHHSKRFHHQRRHSIAAISLFAHGDSYDVKYGFGRVMNKWGYGRNNHCREFGTYVDISFNPTELPSAAIGASAFIYKRYSWPWFNYPYYTIYSKASSALSNPFQQSNIPFQNKKEGSSF